MPWSSTDVKGGSLRRKSRRNLFGINEPQERTFIPMGGPLAHENSKPLPLSPARPLAGYSALLPRQCDFKHRLRVTGVTAAPGPASSQQIFPSGSFLLSRLATNANRFL